MRTRDFGPDCPPKIVSRLINFHVKTVHFLIPTAENPYTPNHI